MAAIIKFRVFWDVVTLKLTDVSECVLPPSSGRLDDGGSQLQRDYTALHPRRFFIFLFPVPVCAITASGVPGGTLVSMNRISTLCG
jgi:hypothetical protein